MDDVGLDFLHAAYVRIQSINQTKTKKNKKNAHQQCTKNYHLVDALQAATTARDEKALISPFDTKRAP